MADSFTKQNDITAWVSDYQQADRLVTNIEAQFAAAKQLMQARKAAIQANTNGSYTNPDDLNKVNAQLAALQARLTTLGQ